MGDVGSRLRAHRQQLGLSLTAAAERAGIPRLRLDLIERGTLPPPSLVPRLVAGLNVSGQLADDLALASSDWRRPQPEDWGGGTCVVVTTNHTTGRERRKEWYYFVLNHQVGPCFLEPAGARARWVRDLLTNPRLRIIVNDGTYEGVAYIATDDAEVVAVKELFQKKYGATGDPNVDDLISNGTAIVATDAPDKVRRALASQPVTT